MKVSTHWQKLWRGRPKRILAAAAVGLALIELNWLLYGPPTTQLDSYRACATAGYPITDTNPPACDSGPQVFLGPAATPAVSLPPFTNQPFETLVDGDSGGNYPKGQQVITTQSAWQHYWREVHAALPALPPLITVNFATASVIALSSGPEATAGYTLRVTGVETGTAGSVVSVIESVPTITCHVADTPSNRYFIAQTTKLALPVTFSLTTEHRQC